MTENEAKAIEWIQNVRNNAVVALSYIKSNKLNASPILYAGGKEKAELLYAERKEKTETIIAAIEELEQYRAIGTVEQCKVLKKQLESAKEDIRKLLCSEYGSSCEFCIYDEDEDALCCNIGGSGSWCCKNAGWKEH